MHKYPIRRRFLNFNIEQKPVPSALAVSSSPPFSLRCLINALFHVSNLAFIRTPPPPSFPHFCSACSSLPSLMVCEQRASVRFIVKCVCISNLFDLHMKTKKKSSGRLECGNILASHCLYFLAILLCFYHLCCKINDWMVFAFERKSNQIEFNNSLK